MGRRKRRRAPVAVIGGRAPLATALSTSSSAESCAALPSQTYNIDSWTDASESWTTEQGGASDECKFISLQAGVLGREALSLLQLSVHAALTTVTQAAG